jgi:hypothetical protein
MWRNEKFPAKKRTPAIQLVPRRYTYWEKEWSKRDVAPLTLFAIECMVMVFISCFFRRIVHLHFVTDKNFAKSPYRRRMRNKIGKHCCGGKLTMSPCRCNRPAQVSACSVVAIPFELDVSVGKSVQCRSSNSERTSNSCANWENLLQWCYRPCSGDTGCKKYAIYDWFPRCKRGQETLEDDQRSGRPSTARIEEMITKGVTADSIDD